MKIFHWSLIIAFLALAACQASQNEEQAKGSHDMHHEQASEPTSDNTRKTLSPRKQAMANIGDVHVHIDYSSPSKRGRTIWNGLVSYGQVWVTGAHSATSVDFSKDVIIEGQTIPRGKYAFFTIPDDSEWTLILNKNYDQHLADDYDVKQDVIRVKVTPNSLKESVESLTYQVVSDNDNSGFISVEWDTLQVRLPIKTK